MILSRECIERPRTPVELRAFVEGVFKSVPADRDEYRLGLGKVDLYKEFLDELVPLSLFATIAYPEDYVVQLILGNQGYDATVREPKSDRVVDRVEITLPHDGREASVDSGLVAERGCGTIHLGSPGDDLAALFPHVTKACESKASKDYGDCTLVLAIAALSPVSGFEDRYEQLIQDLVGTMKTFTFRAKRVFLLVMPERLVLIQSESPRPQPRLGAWTLD